MQQMQNESPLHAQLEPEAIAKLHNALNHICDWSHRTLPLLTNKDSGKTFKTSVATVNSYLVHHEQPTIGTFFDGSQHLSVKLVRAFVKFGTVRDTRRLDNETVRTLIENADFRQAIETKDPGEHVFIASWCFWGHNVGTLNPSPDVIISDPFVDSPTQVPIGSGIPATTRFIICPSVEASNSSRSVITSLEQFDIRRIDYPSANWLPSFINELPAADVCVCTEGETLLLELGAAIAAKVTVIILGPNGLPESLQGQLQQSSTLIIWAAHIDEAMSILHTRSRPTVSSLDDEQATNLKGYDLGTLLSRTVSKSPRPLLQYQSTLIRETIDRALDQTQMILSEIYKSDIELAQSFVKVVGPLFQSAKRLVAFSVDSNSTFWIERPREAKEYLEMQPPCTIRVFICSSPEVLIDYRELLSRHVERYGTTGAVFVTTTKEWANYIKALSRTYTGFRAPDERDFGILENNIADDGLSGRFIRADLSRGNLSFARIPMDSQHENDCAERILVDFELLRERVDQGEGTFEATEAIPWPRPGAFPPLRVVRWSSAMSKSGGLTTLRSHLKVMFEYRELAAYHIIELRSGHEARLRKHLVEAMQGLRASLGWTEFRKLFGIQEFTLLERIVQYEDASNRGLATAPPSVLPVVLLIKFKNQMMLEKYLSDEEHKKVRKKLYFSFGSDMRDLLEKEQELAQILKEPTAPVENAASRYIARIDFRDALGSDEVA